MRKEANAAALPNVVVAMATYRRPDCLARILPELVRQTTSYPGAGSVLVVDNDPEGGAYREVLSWADRGVRYAHEPKPGVAAARNKALAEAGDAEVLVFVDDDGLPLDDWLAELIGHWRQWGCAAVAGPVIPRCESGEPDEWVASSGILDRVKRPTGALVQGAGTGNLLLHLPQLRSYGLSFDEEFGLSGGSDTMLTHALIKLGGQIRWCDEAEVYDYFPASRLNRRWILKRSLRTGNDWSRVALALASSPTARMVQRVDLTARGLVRIGRGLIRYVAGAAGAGIAHRATGARMLATGVGVISGAFGFVWVEYRRKPRLDENSPRRVSVM